MKSVEVYKREILRQIRDLNSIWKPFNSDNVKSIMEGLKDAEKNNVSKALLELLESEYIRDKKEQFEVYITDKGKSFLGDSSNTFETVSYPLGKTSFMTTQLDVIRGELEQAED